MSETPNEELIAGVDGVTVSRSELVSMVGEIAPGIVLLRDHPYASAATWVVQAEAAQAMGSKRDRYFLILDVSGSHKHPKGIHKEAIFRTFRELLTPEAVVMVQPGSALLRAAANFILKAVPIKTILRQSLEEAISETKRLQQKEPS